MVNILAIRHAWPEKAGFRLSRPAGTREYVFIHFTNGAEILLDGSYVTVPPHGCILYRPGTPQYIRSPHPLIHDWFHFTEEGSIPDMYGFCPNTLVYPSKPNFVTDIIREMESEFFARNKGYEALLSVKVAELFLKLSRAEGGLGVETVDGDMSEKLRVLRGEIFLSLNKPWTVARMAAFVGLSQSRFHTVYRTLYGNSPMDDLIRARIDSAKNALLFDNRSVSSIAESLGYNNVTHFIRQFRGLTGMSPVRYRRGGGR